MKEKDEEKMKKTELKNSSLPYQLWVLVRLHSEHLTFSLQSCSRELAGRTSTKVLAYLNSDQKE